MTKWQRNDARISPPPWQRREMIGSLIDFALRNRLMLLALRWSCSSGVIAFHQSADRGLSGRRGPLRAKCHAVAGARGEEVEQQITVPLEVRPERCGAYDPSALGIARGLSQITLLYDDQTHVHRRQEVLDRLQQPTLPTNVNPEWPDYSPTGQIMFYNPEQHEPESTTSWN